MEKNKGNVGLVTKWPWQKVVAQKVGTTAALVAAIDEVAFCSLQKIDGPLIQA